MAMPSAANRTAISTMKPRATGTVARCAGRKPATMQTMITSRPWMHGDRRAAQRPADHDLQARHRRDQRLLQKAELAIPEQAEAGEDRREQHRHADHAGRDELQVAAVAGLLEDRPKPEPEHQQIQHRLAERRDDLRARSRVALQFAQPENINRAHRLPPLHILANCRIWRPGRRSRRGWSSRSARGMRLRATRRRSAP